MLALVILLTTEAFALSTPGPSANKPGDLSIVVVVSSSVQYLRDWMNPEMVNRVTIPRVNKLKPEQVGYCGFILSGLTPSPEPSSMLQYSVGWRLIGPTGETVFGVPEHAKGQFKNPGKPILVMADPALDLIFEATDKAGTYILEATVTDLYTGKKASISYEITLIK
jgi:hypothetical protein